jgi:hypothetical protein
MTLSHSLSLSLDSLSLSQIVARDFLPSPELALVSVSGGVRAVASAGSDDEDERPHSPITHTPFTSLQEFVRGLHWTSDSIEKAHRRLAALSKDEDGVVDFSEFCHILRVAPSPQSRRAFELSSNRLTGLVPLHIYLMALSLISMIRLSLSLSRFSVSDRCPRFSAFS